jgi:hypothetical protein
MRIKAGYYFMNKYILLITLLLTLSIKAVASNHPIDSTSIDQPLHTLPYNEAISQAQKLFNTIETEGRYIENLLALVESGKTIALPVGISQTSAEGNVKYTLGIYQIKFRADRAVVTAFLKIDVPQSVKNQHGATSLFLGGTIGLSYAGGIVEPKKLSLLGDFEIDLDGANAIILKGSNNGQASFAEVDCDGFKELNLQAEVLFSRDVIQPVAADGTIDTNPENRVRGSFTLNRVKNWNDILAEVDFSGNDFQIKGLDGFIFGLQHAVVDMSDVKNATAFKGPANYPQAIDNLWRGVFIESIKVVLPPQFAKRNNRDRLSFEAKNILIDQLGVSGNFTANTGAILSIDEGSAGGWAFSVDNFSLNIVTNTVQGGGFGGGIKLPIDDKSVLAYTATIQQVQNQTKYVLNVKVKDQLQFDLWQAAKVSLDQNSHVTLEVENNLFKPKAVLNGKMTILPMAGTAETSPLGNLEVAFEELTLQAEAPYLSVKALGYKENNQSALANFPVSIPELYMTTSESTATLTMKIKVNLMNSQDGGFGGDASLKIIGAIKQGDILSWQHVRTDLSAVSVEVVNPAFDLKGNIQLFDQDATYGQGFAGSVDLKLKTLGNAGVKAKALFGRKQDYRYWYADVMVGLGAGIPLVPGALNLNSIGGGAYYNMKMVGKADNTNSNSIGASPSGLIYEPDDKTALGLRAAIGIATPTANVFNGIVALEMNFNKQGGLRQITLDGEGKFLQDLPSDFTAALTSGVSQLTSGLVTEGMVAKTVTNQQASLAALVHLNYDVEQQTFIGNFKAYVNVANAIKGIGTDNLAGNVDMLFAPDGWHIYIGEPDYSKRIGLQLALGPATVRADCYFVAGSQIPKFPPPPAEMSSIFKKELNQLSSLEGGGGFGFGASLRAGTGDMKFLIFYANLSAGVGFDLMLKNYGTVATCKNRQGLVGINGWYASGQAYAYLQGEVGVAINVFGADLRQPVLSLSTGALLQAQLPNPTFVNGNILVRYSILGGFVSGSGNFEFSIGEKCELENANPLGGLQVIAGLTPNNMEQDVDVFTAPQAIFNMAVDKEFSIVEGEGNVQNSGSQSSQQAVAKKYKIRLDKFEVKSGGNILSGHAEWNAEQTVAAFYSDQVLPGKTKVTDASPQVEFAVQVSFMEKVGNGWQPVLQNGKPVVEAKTITFTTGKLPDEIPQQNIAYTYPVITQQNYFTDEYDHGYIRLKKGQDYLFDPSTGFKQEIRFYANSSNEPSFVVQDITHQTVDNGQYEIAWLMPKLNAQQAYTMQLVSVPPKDNGVSANVKKQTESIAMQGGTLTKNVQQASGAVVNNEATELKLMRFPYEFRTSQYKTFADKIRDLKQQGNAQTLEAGGLRTYNVEAMVNSIESFDAIDLGTSYGRGSANSIKPLIAAKAVLDNNFYYQNYIYPLVYKDYLADRFSGAVTFTRADKQNILPDWAVYVIRGASSTKFPYFYSLAPEYYHDLMTIQNQLSTQTLRKKYSYIFIDENNQERFTIPSLKPGQYTIQLNYVLPGNRVGSQGTFSMNFNSSNP